MKKAPVFAKPATLAEVVPPDARRIEGNTIDLRGQWVDEGLELHGAHARALTGAAR